MATILEAVATLLAAEGHGTIGTDLWLGEMQDAPAFSRAVYESPGTAPTESFGAAAWAVDRPGLRVMVRGDVDDYPTARDEAAAIRLLLASQVDVTLSGIYVHRISSLGHVEVIGKDADNRPRFAVNFQVWTG